MPESRFRVTIEPPADSGDPPRSFVTLPLEPGEVRSLMIVALRILKTPGWGVRFERLTVDEDEDHAGPTAGPT